MRIFVKVKPGSREAKVVPPTPRLLEIYEKGGEYYTVSVKEPPVEGRANDAVIRVLAEYFKVPRINVKLIAGAVSKTKVFEIA